MAQLGALIGGHVLEVEMRQICLAERGLVGRARTAAGLLLPPRHGVSLSENA